MIAAIRQMRKDKHSRMVSSQQVGMDNLHEATEKVTSGLKKMFVFKTSQYEKNLKMAEKYKKVVFTESSFQKRSLLKWSNDPTGPTHIWCQI